MGDFLGSCLIPFTEARVAEYIHRTDDNHPWYTSGKNPFGAPVAPACTLPSHDSLEIGTWWMPNMHGNLHAKQEWELFAPVLVGQTVLASRTFLDRYEKRGRIYTVCEVLFTDPDSGRLYAKQRHHQSFVADQSPEAVEAWNAGTSVKSAGKVIEKERERMPNPGEVGEVVETFGPVTHEANQVPPLTHADHRPCNSALTRERRVPAGSVRAVCGSDGWRWLWERPPRH